MVNEYSICINCGCLLHYQEVTGPNMAGMFWVSADDGTYGSHVRTHEDEYHSHKFDSLAAEILWMLSLDSCQDDDLGEAESFGWFALFKDFHAILEVDCMGRVYVTRMFSEEETMAEWSLILDDYETFCDAADTEEEYEDWHADDRTEPDYTWDYAH